MQIITIYDFLLLPLYLFLFYFVINIKSKKYGNTPLRKYFITAFFIHMAGSILYAFVIQYYYGYGDSFGYYRSSEFMTEQVFGNDINIFNYLFVSAKEYGNIYDSFKTGDTAMLSLFSNSANFTVVKIAATFSFISFGKYQVITTFFGLFSFLGIWKFFYTFNSILQSKSQKLLAYTILFTPSICFWGSGLMKDSICLGCVGFLVYYLHQTFIIKHFSLKNIFIILINFYLLFMIKSYIASSLLAALVLAYTFYIILIRKTNIISLFLILIVVSSGFIILTISLSSNLESIIDDSKANIEVFKGAYANSSEIDETSMAGFKGADFEVTAGSLIARSPLAIFSTLFRPFLWESKKIIVLFSAMESFIILLATVYLLFLCRVGRFFYYIFTDPYLIFCFSFTMLMCIIIGFSTFNFGTLVRYRLPILPFYFFLLISIYTKHTAKN